MISPAEWHMYRNYTTLLCPGLLLRAPVPVESEPGHGASGEYCITITIRPGFPERRPGIVTTLPPRWSVLSDIIITIIIIICYCHQVCRNQDCHSLLLLPIHIARQMASSTLCCNSLIAQIVKLALLQKSGYSVHDSFCAKVIFHLQFKARTSVCPQMCVYIFQPRHCFLSRLENFAFYSRVSLSQWESSMFHVLSTIGLFSWNKNF